MHRLSVQEDTSKRWRSLSPQDNLGSSREADDLLRQLQEEQRKTVSLSQEMTTSSSSRSRAF